MKIKNLENIDKYLFIFIFLIFNTSIKPILGYEILLNQLFEKNRVAQDEAGGIASIKWKKLESGLKDNKFV